jgi:hypothetical protein
MLNWIVTGLSGTVDVYNTVRLARAQRGGMVQNSAQYRFIYLALQAYIDTNKIRLKRRVTYSFRFILSSEQNNR